MVLSKIFDVPHLGTHWFNEDSITNIISVTDMVKYFRVTFDSDNQLALLVHMPNQLVKFKQMNNKLYAMNPEESKSFSNPTTNFQFVNTLEENDTFLTPRQCERKIERLIYCTVGRPTIRDLNVMIRMDLIKNNEVTMEDLYLATKRYSPDISTIESKSTRRKLAPVVSNIIDIPKELLEVQKDVTLSIDGITVNSLKFLSTISRNLFYRTAQYVRQPTAEVYEKCLNEIFAIYRQGNFEIIDIHCDNKYHKVMDLIVGK